MSGLEIAAIITAIIGLMTAIGKAVSWLVALVQDQSDRTIASLKDENAALKARVETCEREHAP